MFNSSRTVSDFNLSLVRVKTTSGEEFVCLKIGNLDLLYGEEMICYLVSQQLITRKTEIETKEISEETGLYDSQYISKQVPEE